MEQTLGKRISAHRKELGLTQDQMAERLGVTAQAVSKWENDLSCPDIAMLPKLASLFGISIDALLGNEPEKPVHEAEVIQEEDETEGIHVQKGNWEFRMDAGRHGTLWFALTVLITGAQLLAARILDFELSFWSALWPTALVALGIGGLRWKVSFSHLACTLFGLYFALDNWQLFPFSFTGSMVFPVILVLFGLSLVVDALKKPRKPRFRMNHGGSPRNQFRYLPEGFEYSGSFGEHDQYVQLEKLSKGDISTSFGEFTVDLTGVQQVSGMCTVEANCSFGELTIRVPKRFTVKQNGSSAFGSNEISGEPDENCQGTIYLESSVSFGEISVEYV